MKPPVTLLALVAMSIATLHAQSARVGTSEDPTVKSMIAAERMWNAGNCAPQPGLQDVIADDYQGTATNGHRVKKADVIQTDTTALDRECTLGEVAAHFFGDDVAVLYGGESSLRKDTAGIEKKRCLIWTDTWLRRGGKWQIIASQDTVVTCSAK
jgi:hypothetical protein